MQHRTAPLDIDIRPLPAKRAVVEGESFAVDVEAVAERDVVADQVVLEVVQVIDYGYGRTNLHGVIYTARDRSTHVISQQPLPPAGRVMAGETYRTRAVVAVPALNLPSVRGELISISWILRVRMSARNDQESVGEGTFTVQSAAAGCSSDAVQDPEATVQWTASLELVELPARVLTNATPVTGRLRVALHHGTLRSVRVELVMLEAVAYGPTPAGQSGDRPQKHPRHTENTIAATTLTDGLPAAGAEAVLPFEVATPRFLPSPSLDTGKFRVRWQLRITADVPHRPDPQLRVGLVAVTAPQAAHSS
ncbi:hypothetical protein [Arthrobacter zhaoguopingii]|uniref:hypothetical protein n=1 Tax=Arthrobacter zhaoguopingii TaxID=2681491 RepID=UPI001357C7FF|nr:hypothetical protein [Arthrobacter zhaoguopingii]